MPVLLVRLAALSATARSDVRQDFEHAPTRTRGVKDRSPTAEASDPGKMPCDLLLLDHAAGNPLERPQHATLPALHSPVKAAHRTQSAYAQSRGPSH